MPPLPRPRCQALSLGPVYLSKGGGESLATVAARFRTSLTRLRLLNPDVAAATSDAPLAPGQPLCVTPCTQ